MESSIQTKLEDGSFDICDAPCLLYGAVAYGVSMDIDGLDKDELQAFIDGFEDSWRRQTMNRKLQVEGHGDYAVWISWSSTKHFQSREKMDAMFVQASEYDYDPAISTRESVSLEEALDSFDVTLFCNWKYFEDNPDEQRKLPAGDPEQQKAAILKTELAKLFQQDTVAEIMFNDFRILHEDGNDTFATAQRGDKYFMFRFGTS